MDNRQPCVCCGKPVIWTDYQIHTACIKKHWDRHARGKNASRCKTFAWKVR